MDFDDRFKPERYTDPEQLREGMLTDRKMEIPAIWDVPEKRLDFVKDFIALANMSYRFGRVGRLLFGITDDHRIVGVTRQATKAKHWWGIDYSQERDRESLFQQILRDFDRAISEFIEPKTAHLQMKWGWVKDHLVAYLEIGAELSNPRPYRVKKEIRAGGKVLYPREAWRRQGESNQQMTQEEYENWPSHNDCPVISGQHWRRYFERLQSGDFAQAADLPGYQEPRIDGKELLADRVKKFLESEQALLVVEGRAGMGKTKFLRRLVCELARAAVPYVRDLPDDEPPSAWIPVYKELRQKPFRKNDALDKCIISWWNADGGFLAGRSGPKTTSLLKRPHSRWLVCMDGLDEMSKKAIEAFYEALSEFREHYPRVKVIITTRPDAVDPGWERKGVVVKMNELDDEDIRSFLGIAIQGKDEQRAEAETRRLQAIGMLERYSEIAHLVRTPLYLDAYARVFAPEPLPLAELPPPASMAPLALDPVPTTRKTIAPEEFIRRIPNLSAEMGEGVSDSGSEVEASVDGAPLTEDEISDNHPSPPPPLTQVLDRMLERIWDHDRKHFQEPKVSTSVSEPLLNLKQLAARVDGRDKFDAEECRKALKRVKWRERMLSLGLIETRNDWLLFPSRLLQSFLAADWLWHLWQRQKKHALRRLVSADPFWQKAHEFFRELATHDPDAVNVVSQLVGGLGNGIALTQPGAKFD